MVGRQETDEHRRRSHDAQSQGERCLAPHSVAHVAEKTAPTGLARNATPKVLNEAITATNGGSVAGKNVVGKTRAAAVA